MTASSDQGLDLDVLQEAARALRGGDDAVHAVIGWLDPTAFEPPDDVRLPAHRTDANRLLETKVPRGHSGIDPVGEPRVALLEGLDDGRRMDPGRRFEGILPDDRV